MRSCCKYLSELNSPQLLCRFNTRDVTRLSDALQNPN